MTGGETRSSPSVNSCYLNFGLECFETLFDRIGWKDRVFLVLVGSSPGGNSENSTANADNRVFIIESGI